MTPAAYDVWYETPRGRWIGSREFDVLASLLAARPGETLLDVGCGSGYFTRRFAREAGLTVTGVDSSAEVLEFAHARAPELTFARADAARLPFAGGSFDHVVAITALCFVRNEQQALQEMARVARRTVTVGLLNRASLLHRAKAGTNAGGYAGARWHGSLEARAMLAQAGLADIRIRSAIFVPGGGGPARLIEKCLPATLPFGAFLAATGSPELPWASDVVEGLGE
jgi:SAM-dependent methyltransferase